MDNNRIYYGSGLEQSEYLGNIAVLQDFDVIENDWKKLFQWAMRVGRDIDYFDDKNKKVVGTGFTNLWDNQIFSVLIEITQINVESYKNTFIQDEDIYRRYEYIQDLENKIRVWVGRIDGFLEIKLKSGDLTTTNLSVQVAHTVKEQLELTISSLSEQGEITADSSNYEIEYKVTRPYYTLLNVINEIGQKCDFYIGRIEDSGDMDPSLALFVTFVRNYSLIVARLNKLVTTLPALYNSNIRKGCSQAALPDVTELLITPKPDATNSYIFKGTAFPAGKNSDGTDLYYKAIAQTKINHLAINGAYTVYLERESGGNSNVVSIHKKIISYSDPKTITSLFTDDDMSCLSSFGWMIESPMFILHQGERQVSICLNLTDKSAKKLNKYGLDKISWDTAFTLLYSNEKGWGELEPSVQYSTDNSELYIHFSLHEKDAPTTICSKEVHNKISNYPTVQILIKEGVDFSYNWAILTEFSSLKITTTVSGIRDIKLYNEVGELNASVPFHPFGVQAKSGSWFVVGNNEMGEKPLISVALDNTWNKLPFNGGFAEIYKDFSVEPPITNSSFKIKTEWKDGDSWYENTENTQDLFHETTKGVVDSNSTIRFALGQMAQKLNTLDENGWLCNKNNSGLFRVTLTAPSIGFGTDEYMQLFAEVMTQNSTAKETKQKALPLAPIVPIMSDLMLSYVAEHTFMLEEITGNEKTRLYRVNSFSKACPIESRENQYLVNEVETDYNLLLSIKNSVDENFICIYFDLLPYSNDIFENNKYRPEDMPSLGCKYYEDNELKPVTLSDGTNGLTQSGYLMLTFTEQITPRLLDEDGNLLVLIHVDNDTNQCLAIRNIYSNCITVQADGGDGLSLPEATIKQSLEHLPWIEKIIQPFSGTKGRIAEDDKHLLARLSYRCANRKRAVNPSDYEQLVIERFPEIEKVHCIPTSGKDNSNQVYIVVFSRMQNELYPSTPIWLLSSIKEHLEQYTSSWVNINVINPVYERLKIECEFTPRENENIDSIVLRMNTRINDYFASWIKLRELPKINQQYSHKGLYTILANDQGIIKLNKLMVNDKDIKYINFDEDDRYVKGAYTWSVFVPNANHVIYADNMEIGSKTIYIGDNFKII